VPYLLDLCEIILDVLIQDYLPNLSKREFLVRPDFGKIKDIVAELFSLCGGHRLLIGRRLNPLSKYEFGDTYDIHGPGWEPPAFDTFE
jgi:hypothetical protein